MNERVVGIGKVEEEKRRIVWEGKRNVGGIIE
jgi:hypothetical protein